MLAHNVAEAREILTRVGLPVVVSSLFTMGGRYVGISSDAEFDVEVQAALNASVITEILIEPAKETS